MRKRTTKKTGNFSKRTTTISSKGTTQTSSFRPPGGQTRRTVSFNSKTGKTRTTYTTHHGGGWSTSKSTTTGGGKWKPMKGLQLPWFSSGGANREDSETDSFFKGILYSILYILIMGTLWVGMGIIIILLLS